MTARVRAFTVLGLLVALGPLVGTSAAGSAAPATRGVLVVFVPGVSFEGLMAYPAVRAIASHGGAGLVPASDLPRSTITSAFPKADVYPLPSSTIDQRLTLIEVGLGPAPAPVSDLDDQLRTTAARFTVGRLMLVIVGERPSADMRSDGDQLLPAVIGVGPPMSLLAAVGRPRALTSDSTRRTGVIVAADIPTTIDAFVGHAIAGNPEDAAAHGSDIRFVDTSAPFALHDRYLDMRRMWVPVQVAAALFVTIAGLFAIAVLWLGRRAPRPLGLLATGAAASVAPLATALLAAGHLPSLSYATVVPFVVVVTLVLTGLVLLGATGDLLHPMLPLALVVLAYLAVEAALGWTAALTPFLGGSELDGGRFYGLPNVFIGLLLGACLYAAARLPPTSGFVLLLAGGLFAGLPNLGANLGGAVTLFAGAGLWLPLRRRGRLRARELAFALVTVVVGTAVVLVANRISPLPTHITTFEERTDLGGAWSTFVDRLGVGVRLIEHNPFAIVPVIGVVAMLAVMFRPPAVVAESLARHPEWRDALLVLVLASVVAYVANDSGPAACGVGFGMALGGLLYVSVAERTWKMVPA